MKEWYLKKFRETRNLREKQNYAKAAGIKFDIAHYMRRTYLREAWSEH